MASLSDAELLAYMRGHTLAVVSTIGRDGGPQAALVGVAVSDDLGIVFDTVTTSRKHANLLRDARASVTFSGPGEQTLQYEGAALPVSTSSETDAAWRELYYRAWPECRDHVAWPTLAYWRLEAHWLRFSDYDRGPLILERRLR